MGSADLIDDMPMPAMPMYFSTALPTTLLFEGWRVTTTGEYIGACFAIFAMGLLRRVSAWARIALIDVNIRRPPPKRRGQGEYEEFGSDCCSPSDAGPLLREKGVIKGSVLSGWQARLATKLFAWDAFRRSLVALKTADVLLFGASHMLAFLNMLVVMTYNPGFLMAVVGGEMAGVALFESMPAALSTAAAGGAAAGDLDCH